MGYYYYTFHRQRLLSLAAAASCLVVSSVAIAAVEWSRSPPPPPPPPPAHPPSLCAVRYNVQSDCATYSLLNAEQWKSASKARLECGCVPVQTFASLLNMSIHDTTGAPSSSIILAPNTQAFQIPCFDVPTCRNRTRYAMTVEGGVGRGVYVYASNMSAYLGRANGSTDTGWSYESDANTVQSA